MVAQAALPDQVRPRPGASALVSLAHAVLVSATLALLTVAAWLCIRRLTGVWQPLAALPLLLVGVAAVALGSALRGGWWQTGVWPSRVWSRATLVWLSPALAAVLLLTAVSTGGTSVAAVAALWTVLLVHEAVWCGLARRARGGRPTATTPATAPVHLESADRRPGAAVECDDQELSVSAEVSQQITRSESPSSGDTIAGVLRAVFQPGERTRNLHVAFCPPLPTRPEVEVAQLSGPGTRVRAADVQPFGVRFDLRMTAVSVQPENVLIHFVAHCDNPTT